MNVSVFDIECDGFLDTVSTAWCGVFKSLDGKERRAFGPKEIPQMLKYMDTQDVLIGHNIISYDLPVLKKLYGYVFKGKKVDTLLMSRLLNPKRMLPFHAKDRKAGPHSLYAWGVRVGVDKPDHDEWHVFSEEMMHRCSEDVEINWKVYHELLKEAAGDGWKPAFVMTFKLFEYLQLQEEHGWLVDVEHMDRAIHQLETWIRRIDSVIGPKLPMIVEVEETKLKGEYNYIKRPFLKSGEYSKTTLEWCERNLIDPSTRLVSGCFSRISFRPVDLNSNEETKEYLLKEGWEPLEWNTDDEGNRTSPKLSKDDPFEGINGKLGKLVAKRVQCRHRKSSIEGLKKLIRPDGRIPSVITNMAVTGRATHKNIVNIPGKGFFGKWMRKIFICPDDKVIVGCDSDSCQLRMLAGRIGDPDYIQSFVTGDKKLGTDNHSITMKVVDLDSRDTAKTVMYCLLFGGGDVKLGKSANMPGKGAEIREKLYVGLKGLKELVESLTEEWRKTAKRRFNAKFNRMEYYDGVVKGLDGRPIRIPYEHQILVYILQSDEAIMMAAAYVKANHELAKRYKYGEDFAFLCWMHDEYQIECRPEIAEEVGRIASESIEWAGEYFKIQCPHKGDFSVGRDWYETH